VDTVDAVDLVPSNDISYNKALESVGVGVDMVPNTSTRNTSSRRTS
jgi:hypothetical protein